MFRIATLFLLAIAASPSFSADKEVEKLLASMRTAYQAVSSASLRIDSKVKYSFGEVTHKVRFEYEKPNRIHLAFDFQGKTIRRISDGKKVYTFAEEAKPDVAAVSMDALGGDVPVNLETLCFFDSNRQLSTSKEGNMAASTFKLLEGQEWNGRSWYVLEETAKGQNVFVRYWVEPDRFFIGRCEVFGLDKKTFIMDAQVKSMVLNQAIEAKLFQPPKI